MAFGKSVDVRKTDNGRRRTNSGEREDTSNEDLLSFVHTKILDDEDRQNTECPVNDRIQRRDGISQSDQYRRVDALPVGGVKRPESTRWDALKDHNAEECAAEDASAEHQKSYNPDMDWHPRNA